MTAAVVGGPDSGWFRQLLGGFVGLLPRSYVGINYKYAGHHSLRNDRGDL
jgi:hypothetical protein